MTTKDPSKDHEPKEPKPGRDVPPNRPDTRPDTEDSPPDDALPDPNPRGPQSGASAGIPGRQHPLLDHDVPAAQHVSRSVRVEQAGTPLPPATAAETKRAAGPKVRAFAMGYYGEVRRRIGDVFVLADAKDFSDRWMEGVDGRTPVRTTTPNQALRQQHDEEMRARHSPAGQLTERDDVHDVPTGLGDPLGAVRSVSGRE